MSNTVAISDKEYSRRCLGVDDHIGLGVQSNHTGSCYRDILVTGDFTLKIDALASLINTAHNPALKRFNIAVKELKRWQSELPLKSKFVFIGKENE